MKTAVEWFVIELKKLNIEVNFEIEKKAVALFKQAKEMEKEQLLQMSIKSAHYERKWILEAATNFNYNPNKIEIIDLENTALEHYNETFKSL